jgi:hypothetical protein
MEISEINNKTAELKARYEFRKEKNIPMQGMPYWLEKRQDNTFWVSLRGKNNTTVHRVDERVQRDAPGEGISMEGFNYGAFTFHHERLIAIRQGDIASFDMKGNCPEILRRIDNEKLTCVRFVPGLGCFLLVNLSRQRLETLTEEGKSEVFFSYPAAPGGSVPLYPLTYWEQGRDYIHVIGLGGDQLLRIDLSGNPVDSFTLERKGGWFGLAEDHDGNLFLSNRETASVSKLDPSGNPIFTALLPGMEQAACGIGFIALDRERHRLYVCDQKRNRILLYQINSL